MRLKEDDSSYKAASIKRREYRQSPIIDDKVAKKSKKDTKKWCRGKIGVPHEFEMEIPRNSRGILLGFRIDVCKNCGKHGRNMEHYCKTCALWLDWDAWWKEHRNHDW